MEKYLNESKYKNIKAIYIILLFALMFFMILLFSENSQVEAREVKEGCMDVVVENWSNTCCPNVEYTLKGVSDSGENVQLKQNSTSQQYKYNGASSDSQFYGTIFEDIPYGEYQLLVNINDDNYFCCTNSIYFTLAELTGNTRDSEMGRLSYESDAKGDALRLCISFYEKNSCDINVVSLGKDNIKLPNTEFTLYDTKGNEIAKQVTSSEEATIGRLTFKNIKPGEYKLVETKIEDYQGDKYKCDYEHNVIVSNSGGLFLKHDTDTLELRMLAGEGEMAENAYILLSNVKPNETYEIVDSATNELVKEVTANSDGTIKIDGLTSMKENWNGMLSIKNLPMETKYQLIDPDGIVPFDFVMDEYGNYSVNYDLTRYNGVSDPTTSYPIHILENNTIVLTGAGMPIAWDHSEKGAMVHMQEVMNSMNIFFIRNYTNPKSTIEVQNRLVSNVNIQKYPYIYNLENPQGFFHMQNVTDYDYDNTIFSLKGLDGDSQNYNLKFSPQKISADSSNGRYIVEDIPNGTYILTEEQSPYGYYSLVNSVRFNINDTTNQIGKSPFFNIILDDGIKGSFKVKKIDSETSEPVAGAKFSLINSHGEVVETKTTDENGIIQFDNLLDDEYTLKEVQAPSGYKLEENVKTIIVKFGKVFEKKNNNNEYHNLYVSTYGIITEKGSYIQFENLEKNHTYKIEIKNEEMLKNEATPIQLVSDENGSATLNLTEYANQNYNNDYSKVDFIVKDLPSGATYVVKDNNLQLGAIANFDQYGRCTIDFDLYKEDENDTTEKSYEYPTKTLEGDSLLVIWSKLSSSENIEKGNVLHVSEQALKIQYHILNDKIYNISSNAIDNIVVTNNQTVDISVGIVWDDEENKNNIRPESVKLRLLANGKDTGKRIILSQKNNWTGTFEQVEKYIDGKEAKYTIIQDDIEGYVTKTSSDDYQSFEIVNKHTENQYIEKEETKNEKTSKSTKTGDEIEKSIIIFISTIAVLMFTLQKKEFRGKRAKKHKN